ncbi:MAG TPA: GDP-L-fucose synthase [Candidatus Melainabacteria bacterium]|mgnify:CR=1 FL=1|jgi:GDP-L-fucose synthase|nr:GDP-L-fucose synthase [Candidatus Melainabacteria bacterium]HIN67155.1 GDP-L-fucose synthase [Candidatus Obscuribacterales bacterium]
MSSFQLSNKSAILVTGAGGFLGKFVVNKLQEQGFETIYTPTRKDYDLREQADVRLLFQELKPDAVIHLAAVVGGIGANQNHPGQFCYENLIMGTLLLEEARNAGVSKFVTVGTICSYPKFTPVPFREEDLWNGYPEETNAPYGIAKKALLALGQGYRAEYDFNAIYLMPVNLYGPGDNFDPHSSHVIPALIKKCIDAMESKQVELEIWGDGTPTREFLHAGDAAEAIVLALKHYNDGEPTNIGSGSEISIRDLTSMIARLTGFKGNFKFDSSKPNGQPRRALETSKAKERFGFEAKIDLESGLRSTIEWYRSQRPAFAARD